MVTVANRVAKNVSRVERDGCARRHFSHTHTETERDATFMVDFYTHSSEWESETPSSTTSAKHTRTHTHTHTSKQAFIILLQKSGCFRKQVQNTAEPGP